MNVKKEVDEVKAFTGDYQESGVDYLKRVVQVVELELKIRQENKGSTTYLYGQGAAHIGIGKDSKNYQGVCHI